MLSGETHSGNRDGSGELSSGRSLYNYFRTYDPATGRYLEADPIGQTPADPNLYAYARNSPLRFIDPLGLDLSDTLRDWNDRVVDEVKNKIADWGWDYLSRWLPGRVGKCWIEHEECVQGHPTEPEPAFEAHCRDCELERQKCIADVGSDDDGGGALDVQDVIDNYNGHRSVNDKSHSRGPKVPSRDR